ncbi:MAG TPA: hypothetical protein VG537_00990 [Candidatus Kapabacteria bacterium]|jgi:hypothetical protein|nr:hypothetical protein [Candidatus Kapabacteria bacterium]
MFQEFNPTTTPLNAHTLDPNRIMDSLNKADSIRRHQPIPAADLFAVVIQVIVGVVVLAAWGVISYYLFRFFRTRLKSKKGTLPLNSVYGSWQGHNLGTTTIEPGDLTHIEKELQDTPKDSG